MMMMMTMKRDKLVEFARTWNPVHSGLLLRVLLLRGI
jgi:hypothetical protein